MGTERALLAMTLAALGCGSAPAPKPAEPKATAVSEVERFMPLADDTVYSYDTFSESSGERGVLVLRIRRPRPELAELDVAGRVQRLTVSESGLQLASGGYLLLAPLREGAQWRGDFGKVRVTRVDHTSEVPAGRFAGCIETIEELSSPEVMKRTTTVFCPDVGITVRETEAEAGGQYALERMTLKSFGKAFSLTDPE
jgi:hypothetical protein